jgi:Flp pilus assembly protein TadD
LSSAKSAACGAAVIVLVLGLLAGPWWRARSEDEPVRPVNLLLITIDTLRADAIGSDGGRRTSPTPTLDRLTDVGVRFSNAHAHNVVTLPSHANILTGRLPTEHGVRDNSGFRLSSDVDTLATLLRRRGYRTGAFVSAFPLDSRFGLAAGFDVYDDRLAAGTGGAFLIQERPAERTVAAARAWIDAAGVTPWFTWVHLYEPHYPYAPPPRFAANWPDDSYLGEVAAADAAISPLVDRVVSARPRGETLVIVTSDHGEALGEHGEASHGVFAYESVLRVPLVMFAPGLFSSGTVDVQAQHVDLLPTALDALGMPIPEGLAGRSLLPAMTGLPEPAEPVVYFEALSASLTRGWAPLRGLIHDGFKYIELPLPELYDLRRDPGESENLVATETGRVTALRTRLERTVSDEARPRSRAETAEVRERLRSLGYASGGGTPPPTGATEADDPKNLIALDAASQEILQRYLDGDLAGALTRSRALVEQRPSMAVSWMQLAQLEREGGNAVAAIEAMRRAVALRPGDAEPLALLGAYLTEAGRAREAAALLAPHAQQPQADPDLVAACAVALGRLGQFDAARGLLARARMQDPTNLTLLLHLGTLELSSGRRAEAARAFNEAVTVDPEDARAHGSLGALAIEDGRPTQAAEHWRAATERDPREHRRILALGIALARAGRTSDARACFGFFVAHAPENRYAVELARARAWLNGVR